MMLQFPVIDSTCTQLRIILMALAALVATSVIDSGGEMQRLTIDGAPHQEWIG